MLADLNMTGGLIYSPRVLLALVAKGAYRDTAYRWVQRNAMKRWLQGEDFYENLCKDEDVRKYLTPEEITGPCSPMWTRSSPVSASDRRGCAIIQDV